VTGETKRIIDLRGDVMRAAEQLIQPEPLQLHRCTASRLMNFNHRINGRFLCFAAVACLLLSAPHCQDYFERDTKIDIDGKNPPTFTFSGNGDVLSIAVTDVSENELSMYAPERAMWEIAATSETTPDHFPKITYGVFPVGFVQKWPTTGSPRALEAEKPYRVTVPTSNANSGKLIFLVRNGQALRAEQADDLQWYVQTPTPK